MRTVSLLILVVLVLALVVASPFLNKPAASSGPTVQVSVVASDPHGLPLQYRWKSTDGTITNANAATTTWVLPPGPGIHFAYVLVANNHGGYTERRIAVNTDTIGTPPVIPPPLTLEAPAQAVPTGDFYRSYIESVVPFSQFTHGYTQNVPVFVKDTVTGKRYPPSTSVATDFRGEFIVPDVPPGNVDTVSCSFNGGSTFINCTPPLNSPSFAMPAEATTDYSGSTNASTNQPTNGFVQLADGNPCGTINEFFGITSTGSVKLLNSTGGTISTAKPSELGMFSFPYNANARSVQVTCESAPPISISFTPSTGGVFLPTAVVSGASEPLVSTMTASFNGTGVGTFLPPPSRLPSDIVTPTEVFLGEKGVDSRLSACLYYKAVGAVQTCSSSGVPSGAISFDDWMRTVRIGKYAGTGATEYVANYVNKADLNLTRNHHSISYGPNETAAYVCNYQGPTFALVNSQADVNTVVANAVAGKNLVACVAMDWTITVGVNGNQPFIRFLIFGPSGQLLPSVNLDGRREKFVPGTCVVCHSGDHYAGKYPEDGTGPANVGGHYLPYDEGNFLFSTQVGLRQVDQESAIYHLNQNVLNAGPTAAETALINGWYATSQVQNEHYLPPSWNGRPAAETTFYESVYARSCRGCHVALTSQYDFDNRNNVSTDLLSTPVCSAGTSTNWRSHSMPNSLVTFNRFWLSHTTPTAGVPDQVKIWDSFPGVSGPPGSTCNE
jgi:hypothetical protein